MQRAKKAVEALDIVGAVVVTDYRYDLHGIRLHGEEWVITFAMPVFYNHRISNEGNGGVSRGDSNERKKEENRNGYRKTAGERDYRVPCR